MNPLDKFEEWRKRRKEILKEINRNRAAQEEFNPRKYS